ncbi:rhodanese-like domain-containing protein [Lacrimispora sp.]|uniref:rhodanese-like domain-containing protein n=1 Tax=Lacrimispora sp. TaxID=2719234 RepID=UPI002F3EE6D4
MKKKFLSAVLVSAMTVSMIAGCSSGNKAEKKETTAVERTAAESTLGAEGTAAAESTSAAKNTGKKEYQFVSAGDAVKAAADGKTHVLDVREWSNYGAGRVANSEWCPIFPLEDESLADQMKAYAEENLKDGEKIYIICNSGQRGAQKSTEVLEEAGIDAALIYTVEGGAKPWQKKKVR